MDGGAWCRLLSLGSQSRAPLSDITIPILTADRGKKKRKSFLEKEIESIIQSFKLVLQIFTHNIDIPGHDNNLRERRKKKKRQKKQTHRDPYIVFNTYEL